MEAMVEAETEEVKKKKRMRPKAASTAIPLLRFPDILKP